jgi:hypothetical protein
MAQDPRSLSEAPMVIDEGQCGLERVDYWLFLQQSR